MLKLIIGQLFCSKKQRVSLLKNMSWPKLLREKQMGHDNKLSHDNRIGRRNKCATKMDCDDGLVVETLNRNKEMKSWQPSIGRNHKSYRYKKWPNIVTILARARRVSSNSDTTQQLLPCMSQRELVDNHEKGTCHRLLQCAFKLFLINKEPNLHWRKISSISITTNFDTILFF